MSVTILRGNARSLPLPDDSVDLLITSPPYFGQRDYRDGGESLAGQIGAEGTPREYLDNLLACTAEWMRVLKPSGSIWVNLGDKFSQRVQVRRSSHQPGIFPGKFPEFGDSWAEQSANGATRMPHQNVAAAGGRPVPEKSLIGLPWRYAIRCTDELGLILRQDIVWAKANGMPESVGDRCRRAHEYLFHFVKQRHYFSAVDEIREAHVRNWSPEHNGGRGGWDRGDHLNAGMAEAAAHPLGALPGTVWKIATQPLNVPGHVGLRHFAAFPAELPRRIILGWSPSGVCTECGEGRRPVSVKGATGRTEDPASWSESVAYFPAEGRKPIAKTTFQRGVTNTITGYACACTPYTDHPERRVPTTTPGRERRQDGPARDALGLRRHHGNDWPDRQPVRDYHFDAWQPAPTRPALVVDPFAGTGTTGLVADVLGRDTVLVDLSADYCRLAAWRTGDPGERARALGVPKPPPVPDGQGELDLFGGDAA